VVDEETMAFHRAGIGVVGAYPYPAAALPSNGVDNFSGELHGTSTLAAATDGSVHER
jgi:hypothetical protein